MNNKTILITGGNAGIGKATAIALAKKGAEVVIACRNESKAQEAVKEIRQKSNNEAVSYLLVDLSSLEDVRKLARKYKEKYKQLDVLINNAGLVVNSLQLTKEGYELQFGVNHLAHFLLTDLLLDLLKAAPQGRIVNVASKAHYSGKIDFDNLRGEKPNYKGMNAYSRSKLANVLFTQGLAKRLEGTRVTANCLHPGVVRTSIGNKDSWLFSLIWTLIKPFMITPEKGARSSIHLATSAELKEVSGIYFNENQEERRPSKLARGEEGEKLADKLWDFSTKAVAHIA